MPQVTATHSPAEVLLTSVGGDFHARLTGPAVSDGLEFAFYLVRDGERVATRWYTSEPEALFAGPHKQGRYEALGFIRVSPDQKVRRGRSAPLQQVGTHARPVDLENAPGAILHIGLPKTGTTYLQRTFHRALQEAESFPIDYPDTDFYNHQIALYEPLHAHLPWKPKPGDPALWGKLKWRLQTPGQRRILLSAEALSGLDQPGIELFRSLLGGRRVDRIVITTRSLASLLPSHWQQNMKQGGRGSLEFYADRILGAIREERSPSQMFCVAHTVRLWHEVFPDTPISVLEMDGGQTQNLLAFADICGVGSEQDGRLLSSVPPASEQNLSFSVDECRQLIEINESIAKGRLDVSARRKAMDSFFRAREHRTAYKKPSLDPARAATTLEVDRHSREAVDALPGCEWIHGKESRQPTAEGSVE